MTKRTNPVYVSKNGGTMITAETPSLAKDTLIFATSNTTASHVIGEKRRQVKATLLKIEATDKLLPTYS